MAMQDRSAYGNIENWKTDSREITGPEDIFVALPGYHTDGHRFIPQAVEKGAGTIVCCREVSVPPQVKMLLDTQVDNLVAGMVAVVLVHLAGQAQAVAVQIFVLIAQIFQHVS